MRLSHYEEYVELLAYQLVRQFNATTLETHEQLATILKDMDCPIDCEVWVSHLTSQGKGSACLFWYGCPVLVKYRGKTWLLTDQFTYKNDIKYFLDTADTRITTKVFMKAFPSAEELVVDYAPF